MSQILEDQLTFDAKLERALKDKNPFLYACKNCPKEVVTKILDIKGETTINHDDYELGFRLACNNEHLDTAQLLYDTVKGETGGKLIDIHVDYDLAFYYACLKGRLDVAKFLYKISTTYAEEKPISIRAFNERAFFTACTNGYLNLAIWVYETALSNGEGKPISGDIDLAFIFACENGHQDIAEWLYDIAKPNIHSHLESAFRWACRKGHLNIAKWLIKLAKTEANGQPINICADNDDAYKHSDETTKKWIREELGPRLSIVD